MCVSQGLKTYNGYSFGFVRGISLEKINYFLISRRHRTVWKSNVLREINFDEVSESVKHKISEFKIEKLSKSISRKIPRLVGKSLDFITVRGAASL